MTDREVQRILKRIGGGAKPRPGFKQELGELLAAELEEEEPDAKGILRLIDGPVAPRKGFKAELGAMLAAELEQSDRTPTPAGAAARQRGRIGRLVTDRLKGGWWMQSAAAVVALAIVASGFAWTNCLQTIGPPETQVAAPEVPGEVVDVPSELAPAPTGVHEGSPSQTAAESGSQAAPPGPQLGAAGAGTAPPGGAPVPSGNTEPAPAPEGPPDSGHQESVSPGPSAEPPAVLALASRTDDGYWHIFTMHEDGTHRAQLTEGPSNDREPEWSPDGKRIAFMRIADVSDHVGRIFIVNADGSGLRFLVDGAEPVWSPDGTRLAYSALDPSAPVQSSKTIWVIDVDGSNAHPLLSGRAVEPSWSPRDDLISFASVLRGAPQPVEETNVFTVRPDGSGIRRLTDNPYACNTSFSPNGRAIAYVAVTDSPFDIWTMRPDGSDKTRLTGGPEFDFYPHWSPNAKRIAFGRDPDADPHWSPVFVAGGPGPSAIWLMNADGSDQHRISPSGVDDADPAFRPAMRRKGPRSSDG